MYKYKNSQLVRDVLQKTKGKVLIHPAMRMNIKKVPNCLWEGRYIKEENKIIGRNMLGKIWMDIRDNSVDDNSDDNEAETNSDI